MKQRTMIIIGAAGLLIAALLFLNFHAAYSNTRVENNIITTSIGEDLPTVLRGLDPVMVVIEGEGPLAEAMRSALLPELVKAGVNAQLVNAFPTELRQPLLLIKVPKTGLWTGMLWTPVFASSEMSVQAGYTSNGDTSFMGPNPAPLDNVNGPALRSIGQYKLLDSSYGLISYRGYAQMMADGLAPKIAEGVGNLYKK